MRASHSVGIGHGCHNATVALVVLCSLHPSRTGIGLVHRGSEMFAGLNINAALFDFHANQYAKTIRKKKSLNIPF